MKTQMQKAFFVQKMNIMGSVFGSETPKNSKKIYNFYYKLIEIKITV